MAFFKILKGEYRKEFLVHYYKRSKVETALSMIKGKFGDTVHSKSDLGQLHEVLCTVLCHESGDPNGMNTFRSARVLLHAAASPESRG